jgi:ABC-type sugar transport system permease subunit
MKKNIFVAYLLLLPFFTLFTIFYIVPLILCAYQSLFKVSVRGDVYVGLKNYEEALYDPFFHLSFLNTLIYVGLLAILGFIPLLLVFLLEMYIPYNSKFKKVFQIVTLAPWVITWVSISLPWKWFFSSIFLHWVEVVSSIIGSSMTITSYQNPLTTESSLIVIAFIQLWVYLGYNILILGAGFRSVPPEIIEAAQIDGASKLRTFFSIIIPAMMPYIVFTTITGLIFNFQIFDPIWLLTEGGPEWKSSSIAFYLVKQAKGWFNYGYASALGIIIIPVILVISLVQFKILYKRMI